MIAARYTTLCNFRVSTSRTIIDRQSNKSKDHRSLQVQVLYQRLTAVHFHRSQFSSSRIERSRFSNELFGTMTPTDDASKKEPPKAGVAASDEVQKFVDEAGDRLVVIDLRNPNAEVEPGDQTSLQVGPLPDNEANVRPKAVHVVWDRTTGTMAVPPSLLEDKTTPIITHCGAGGRGQLAKEYLEQQYGFTNVLNGGGPKETENWKVFGEK
jgi:rhodanese-related sulfurtransferase